MAEALRREGVGSDDGARVRLLVTGGHADAGAFDASFRLHLACAAPELDLDDLEIVHQPVDRVCLGCGATSASIELEEPCPRCGTRSLSIPTPEHVEIQLVRPDGQVT